MNQQNAESKLEHFKQKISVIISATNTSGNQKRDAIIEAAKEYWQSLTTPAGNEVEEILKKYKTFVSNIEWHIKTNEPKGDDLKQCELRLDCYNEIVTDLERTPSKPHLLSKKFINSFFNVLPVVQ